MRYYIGDVARLRRAVEDTAMSVFDGWSYEEVVTPSLDYYTLFEQGMGQTEAQRAFRFTDIDGRLLALRPDVTSSVARAAATLLAERTRPLRLCYTAPVFRQQQQSHEWRRETTQLGAELIGAGGRVADLEVLAIAAEVLVKLRLEGSYCVTISNAEVFNGIAENLGLNDESREQMRTLIDKRDAVELQRFLMLYTTSEEERRIFSRLTQLSGKREILTEARRVITNPRSVAALDALDGLWRVIESLGLAESFEIDLGDVSGLDYYTGLIFKIYVRGSGARIGRGGRYDRLTANFGKSEPAVGFVLDLDALTEVMMRTDSKLLAVPPENRTPVANADVSEIFRQATDLRAQGEPVCLDLSEEDKR